MQIVHLLYNSPNIHIQTFRKNFSFIWGCIFPVSILNYSYKAAKMLINLILLIVSNNAEYSENTGIPQILKVSTNHKFTRTFKMLSHQNLINNLKLCRYDHCKSKVDILCTLMYFNIINPISCVFLLQWGVARLHTKSESRDLKIQKKQTSKFYQSFMKMTSSLRWFEKMWMSHKLYLIRDTSKVKVAKNLLS